MRRPGTGRARAVGAWRGSAPPRGPPRGRRGGARGGRAPRGPAGGAGEGRTRGKGRLYLPCNAEAVVRQDGKLRSGSGPFTVWHLPGFVAGVQGRMRWVGESGRAGQQPIVAILH